MQQDYLKEYLGKISADIRKIYKMIEKDRERDAAVVEFMSESKADRKALRELVEDMRDKVDNVAEMFGIPKKKGLYYLIVAFFSGAAVASGTINYQKLIEKLIPFSGH